MGFQGTEHNPFALEHPTRSKELSKLYPRLSNGELPMSPKDRLDRARLAAEFGFLVDPVTGTAFWGVPQFDLAGKRE